MNPARYDAIADYYAREFTSLEDPVSVAILELIGSPASLRILDIACGHGRLSRELARRGAQVTGLDISPALVAMALATEQDENLGISYLLADVAAHWPGQPAEYDLVTCNFGLSDIDDLDGCATAVSRALKPGGAFVFGILHPCFPGGGGISGSWPTTTSYYDEGRWTADGTLSALRQQIGSSHRMLSSYLNALTRHGLVLDRMLEPAPAKSWADARPAASAYPLFLVARYLQSTRPAR
jgi:2-polyprenyl-3-methyl-5-hydroxy-6-metoxy-1,4-benzoquinol methylase